MHVGGTAIYQRLTALPRIRWASQSEVVAGQYNRVQMLANGQVNSDTVLLSASGPAASGQPGTVHVDEDGLDTVSTTVNAQGLGYLVVADADQAGWNATLDGKKTPLVPADEGVVAVAVPAGTHTITLHFSTPRGTIAYALTAVTIAGLVAVVLGEVWWTRRRRRQEEPAAVA